MVVLLWVNADSLGQNQGIGVYKTIICEGSGFPELEDSMLLISLPARIHDRSHDTKIHIESERS
jgi:hypothetical protein